MTKIKAVLFDLDGVLIDATEWHYEALNKALSLFGYEIDRDSHVSQFNGLPTKKKLEMLSNQKGLPQSLHDFINKMKQKYTGEIIFNKCRPSFEKQLMLSKLKSKGHKVAVCSNSIRSSIGLMLEKSGLMPFIDFYIGNDEGLTPKPDPAVYLEAMNRLNLKPEEVVIVEDAPQGIAAAKASGANVCEVSGFNEVDYSRITNFIKQVEEK